MAQNGNCHGPYSTGKPCAGLLEKWSREEGNGSRFRPSKLKSAAPSPSNESVRESHSGNGGKTPISSIFRILSSGPLTAAEIAKKLGLKSAKDVSPALYKMQRKGFVDKMEESNLWKLRKNTECQKNLLEKENFLGQRFQTSKNRGLAESLPRSRLPLSRRPTNINNVHTSSSSSCTSLSRSTAEKQPKCDLEYKGSIAKVTEEPPVWTLPNPGSRTGVSQLGHNLLEMQLCSQSQASSRTGYQSAQPKSHYRENYEHLSRLGQGGFGMVFKVKFKLTKKEYAVKCIQLDNSHRSKKKAVKEVHALEKIYHRNIVRYHTAWIEESFPLGCRELDESDCDTNSSQSMASSCPKQWTSQSPANGQGLRPCERVRQVANGSFIVFKGEASSKPSYVLEVSEDTNSISRGGPGPIPETSRTLQEESVFLCIQMELCHEQTLAGWLLDNPGIGVDDKLPYYQQIVEAVCYIHSRNLIHRDLKPSNIFFSMDEDHCLKIGDFGLVTFEEHSSSNGDGDKKAGKHTRGVGTEFYQSPEQCSGGRYSYKVDIYALGVIFLEMMSPFRTEYERRMELSNLKRSKADSLKQFWQLYPSGAFFVASLLDEDPAKRPTAEKILLNPLLRAKSKALKESASQ